MTRVPPSAQTKDRIAALFREGTEAEPPTELIRLAVRQIVEETLETAVRDLLGRGYFRAQGRRRHQERKQGGRQNLDRAVACRQHRLRAAHVGRLERRVRMRSAGPRTSRDVDDAERMVTRAVEASCDELPRGEHGRG